MTKWNFLPFPYCMDSIMGVHAGTQVTTIPKTDPVQNWKENDK